MQEVKHPVPPSLGWKKVGTSPQVGTSKRIRKGGDVGRRANLLLRNPADLQRYACREGAGGGHDLSSGNTDPPSSISPTCRPFPGRAGKGRHVSWMAASKNLSHRRAALLRPTSKGGTLLRCKPKGRHVAGVQNTPKRRAALLVSSARRAALFVASKIRAVFFCHLLDVPSFVVVGSPSKARAALSRHGFPIGSTCRPLSLLDGHQRHVPPFLGVVCERAARR